MNSYFPNAFKTAALLVLLASTILQAEAIPDSISVKRIQAASGTHYLWINQGNSTAHWTRMRPKKEDKGIVLCIPAAFTDPYGGIDGIYACSGQPFNENKPDDKIGGVVAVLDGKCKVMQAPAGKIDGELGRVLKLNKGDLFQQFQVVANGKGEKFRDHSCLQRRGVAILKDGATAIVESNEPITLTQFGEDAVSMGVEQLAYTDMGPWDEGWYRNPIDGKLITIGHDRSLTNRQSNWLYFRTSKPE